MIRTSLCAASAVMLFVTGVVAQSVQVPKELSGRWTLAAAGRTNTFSLDDISAGPDASFTAKLTWWTTDPKCTVRKEPISGKVTATGIAFNAATKCGVEFTAVLNQTGNEWLGEAVGKAPNSPAVELKAR